MDCDGKRQRRFSCKHGTREEGGKAGVEQEITEGTEMEGQHKPLTDSGNAISISPLSPFPPVQSQTHQPTEGKEKGKQKSEIEGGKAGVEQERTEETEGDEGST